MLLGKIMMAWQIHAREESVFDDCFDSLDINLVVVFFRFVGFAIEGVIRMYSLLFMRKLLGVYFVYQIVIVHEFDRGKGTFRNQLSYSFLPILER